VSDEKTKEKSDDLEEAMTNEQEQPVVTEDDGEILEEELSLEEQLLEVREEAARNLDNSLRAQAELSNARKRFEKQQRMAYTNANADLVSKLLPVLDDFDRAIENAPAAIQEDNWFEGIELVQRKMLTILENLNVTEIEALGQPFDPNFHDALAQEPSDEYEGGTVMRVMLKGYQLGDKVVRPSLVTVAA
jgi:molecular chaperone GrpE